jgi:hypothetical protein
MIGRFHFGMLQEDMMEPMLYVKIDFLCRYQGSGMTTYLQTFVLLPCDLIKDKLHLLEKLVDSAHL